MKKTLILSLSLVMLLAVAVFTGCSDGPGQYDGEGIDIGEGAITFRFEMTDQDGEVTAWNVSTDQTMLGDALLEVGLIRGEESAHGLMVSHVYDVRADWNLDNAWWALYIDETRSDYGVSSVEIDSEVKYAFVFTPAS